MENYIQWPAHFSESAIRTGDRTHSEIAQWTTAIHTKASVHLLIIYIRFISRTEIYPLSDAVSSQRLLAIIAQVAAMAQSETSSVMLSLSLY
jgi:hypothetical protein